MEIRKRIAEWYRGRYVPPPKNDPDSYVFVISPGYYEQPMLAKVIRVIWQFYLSHWKWLWGILATVVIALIFS